MKNSYFDESSLSVNRLKYVGVLCLLFLPLFIQAQWTNSINNDDFNSIYFTDTNTGYVVGGNGMILKTTDAGVTWNAMTSGTSESLLSVHFPDANNGYVVGESGTILKTTDAGVTWNTMTSGTGVRLNSVYFTDVNTGYAVGNSGIVLKTVDEGVTWNSQTPSGTSIAFQSVHFPDVNNGFTVGTNGRILKTTDAGVIWTGLSPVSFTFFSVYFVDSNTGYAVGGSTSGAILKTNDAGNTWTSQNPGSSVLNSVYFMDANTGYAVGRNGTILKTSNGGSSWVSQSSGIVRNINSVYFTDGNTGYVIGQSGKISKTIDAGNSWNSLISGGGISGLNSVFFTDANIGYIVGSSEILLKTSDAGNSWKSQIPEISSSSLISVYFTDANTGYAVGSGGTILKTTDAGETWLPQTSGTGESLFSVHFPEANIGYAVGNDGEIIKTSNAGNTWVTLTSGTTANLRSVYFTDANTGYVCSYGTGTIAKTIDGGNNWVSISTGVSSFFNSIYFTDANIGYAVGSGGAIVKTTDAGSSWTPQTSGTTQALRSVYFPDANTGYAVGFGGTIVKTTDAGNTWLPQTSGTSLDLYSVYFPDANTGYSAGNEGIVLKYVPTVTEPTTQANTPTFSNITSTSMQIDWTGGNGVSSFVVMREGSAITDVPSDGTSYTANSVFGDGENIGNNTYVVYNGSGNSVTVTGLNPNTNYDIQIFEFNGMAGSENYLTSVDASADKNTISEEPTNPPTAFTATADSDSQITLNWTDATGAQLPSDYLVLANTTGTFTDPVDGTAQSNDFALGDGSAVVNVAHGTGSHVFTGLNANTQYYFKIFSYNGSGTGINYKIDGTPPTDNATTLAGITEPTLQATSPNATSITETSATISWTNGDGSNRLVIVREGSAPSGGPADGTDYITNADFSSFSSTLGDGKVVYTGTGNSFSLTGLSAATTYHVQVFEFNGSGINTDYLLTSAPTTSFMTSTASAPEINIQVNASTIASGGNIPFGTVDVGITDTRTVVIQNTGTSDLLVSNITLGTGSDYTLSSLPSFPLGIVAGGSSSFTLNFIPSSAISFTDVVTITNSDSDEGTYMLNLSGTGQVGVSGLEIERGGTAVTAASIIDFGSVVWDASSSEETFTIRNTGTGVLILQDNPFVSITGNEGHFVVTQQPTGSIPVGGTSDFKIQFTPQSADLEIQSVQIFSNINGFSNPTTFTIRGQGLRQTLTAPSAFIATALSDTDINITWNDSPDDEGYILSKSLDNTNYLVLEILPANTTSYLDNTLVANQTVYYKIQAISEKGESSEIFSAPTTTKNPPSTPQALLANTLSQSQIFLTWEDEANNETGFAIERSQNPNEGFVEIGTVGVNITTYTDNGLVGNTEYFYRVRAVNATEGNSDYSNVSGAFTSNVPLIPTNLTLSIDGNNDVVLNWQDNSDNEEAFRVERFNSLQEVNNFIEIIRLPANTTSYVDTTTAPNQIYIYRLKASNEEGISLASDAVSIETPIDPNVSPPNEIPQELNAEPVSETEIALSWRPVALSSGRGSRNINDFVRVEIATNVNGPFTEIAQIPITKNRYQLTGLTKDVVYHFRIRYANDGGESEYSTLSSATPECRLIASLSDDKDDVIASICDGKSALLTLKTNVIEANYQWTRNGLALSNSNQTFYYATESGEYNCIITAGECSKTGLVPVVVTLVEPTIVTISQIDNVLEANLNNAAAYQWYQNEEVIEGANTFQYSPSEDGNYYVVMGQDGCSSTSNFIFFSTTAITETISDEIIIYPNPASEYIELSWENDYLGSYSLNLYDMTGKKYELKEDMKSTTLLQEMIDLSSFKSGIYLLELQGEGFQAIKKVIKE